MTDQGRQAQINGVVAVQARCAECGNDIPAGARFWPFCGHEQLVSQQCDHCGANLPPEAAFCPRCGHPADEHPGEVVCPGCHATNLPGAVYCNQCGDRLG